MFQTLIESRATRTRSFGGSMISVVVHAGIVGALVVATAQATVAHVAEQRETAVKFPTVTPPPTPPAPTAPRIFTAAPIAKGFTVLRTPIDIPTSLPAVNLNVPPTNLDDFTGIGKPGGRTNGVEGATGVAPALNGVFLESEVERPVAVLPGTAGPAYPEARGARVAQLVQQSFQFTVRRD